MQTLVQTKRVDDEEQKQAVLQILADKYCKQILHNTMLRPKSAMAISSETGIPISTVYRRIQVLCDNKLLSISGTISECGKKYFLYKSKIKSISLTCDCSSVQIEIVPNITHSSGDYLFDN